MAINRDGARFGTFAEIGGGQEVVRWFFRAGGASSTVAKSISAYDKVVSDSLYGPATHFVSRERLEAMLDHEWKRLMEREDQIRGEKSAFFVFADTVATHSRSRHQDGQGWMGVRFQAEPRAPYSEIVIHAQLVDPVYSNEQEVLGILGVNLLHGAFYDYKKPADLIASLMDDLSRRRVQIDTLNFDGPAFTGVDERLMSLRLLQLGYTDAILFTANGEIVQPSEVLYNKPVLIERGRFRPVTNVTIDMLNRALDRFRKLPGIDGAEPVVLMEMTLKNLMTEQKVDYQEFLSRADTLAVLGQTVMISNYTRFDRVTTDLRHYTQNWLGLVLGTPLLKRIFDEKYYTDIEGGLLEGLGRMFRGPVKLFIYPTRLDSGEVERASSITLGPDLQPLLDYLRYRKEVEPIEDFDAEQIHVQPRDVLASIQSGEAGWEQYVPGPVADMIKLKHLFGYPGDGSGKSGT
jgi:hypothetical protein